MNVVDAHVGSRVSRTRQMRGVSVSELADALSAPVWQVELFESGAARMSAQMLIACGRFLKVRPSFFLEGEIEIRRGRSKTQRPLALVPTQGADTERVLLIVTRMPQGVDSRAS